MPISRIRSYGPVRPSPLRSWESVSRLEPKDKELRDKEKPAVQPNDGKEEVEKATEKELASVLTVKAINLLITENTKAHHTDKYENTEKRERDGKTLEAELVIRRAAEFEMTIEFSRPYNKVQDDLHLTFKIGKSPIPTKGSLASLKLEEGPDTGDKSDNWRARIVKKENNFMTVAVYVPSRCIVGQWEFNVKTVVDDVDGKKLIYMYENPSDVFILLNPWSKEDTCYLSDDYLLKEYILNDSGAIWMGTYRKHWPRPWNFAQFADGILEASMHLLVLGLRFAIDKDMGDPVFIARALSKIVNSQDDDGLIEGNWSGKYDEGTRPTSWAGSLEILKEYMKTGKTVKYGQCWVFSGALTTVCRAIGLPCRSVTNFESAHDTDMSCTVDKVFKWTGDDELSKVDKLSTDSIWNFHVWNEVWMKREDLPPGYDGWQVIDATPQERSNGLFRLGPAPVAAIKKGEVNINYDTPFVYGEVNADCIEWLLDGEDEYYLLEIKEFEVGKKISTKIANGVGLRGEEYVTEDREDLTDYYKFKEGTLDERYSMELAHKIREKKRNPFPEDAIIEMKLNELDGIMVGEDFEYKISVKNTGTVDRYARPLFNLELHSYKGESFALISRERFKERLIKSGQTETFTAKIPASKYVGQTTEQFSFAVTAFCFVKEQSRIIIEEDKFKLIVPDIIIEAPKTCKADETIQVHAYFKNPLNKPLTGCKLRVEGSLRTTEVENGGILELSDVPSKAKWERKFAFKPKAKIEAGKECDLYLNFDCEELCDIIGSHTLKISG